MSGSSAAAALVAAGVAAVARVPWWLERFGESVLVYMLPNGMFSNGS